VPDVKVDHRLRQVCAHPLRMRILTALTEGVMSPSELADRLGEPLHSIAYHVRCLKQLGSVELVDKRVNGTVVEHFYRRTAQPYVSDDEFAELSAEQRTALIAATLEDVWRDTLMALAGGGFSRRADVMLHRLPLQLDSEAWAELKPQIEAVFERAQELSAQTLARQADRANPDDPPVAARLTVMFFEAAVDD
jgi:DNA-binding transcriptional ArsR family regulator